MICASGGPCQQHKTARGENRLIDAFRANRFGEADVTFFGQPEHGGKAGQVARTVHAVFVGIFDAADVADFNDIWVWKHRVQLAENLCSVTEELFDIDPTHWLRNPRRPFVKFGIALISNLFIDIIVLRGKN